MAVISVQSPTTGVSYTVQIGGDTPTPTEQERINQYIAQQDAAVQGMMGGQSSAASGEEPSTIGEIGRGIGRGFLGSLAAAPAGIGALGEAAYGKVFGEDVAIGDTAIGGKLRDISSGLGAGVEYLFGAPAETTSGRIGEAVGSIGSFLIPGATAATGARLLGAAGAAQGLAAGAAGTAFGSALGADYQASRIGDAILSGEVVDPAAQQSAVLWGGLIGAGEMVAGGAASKVIGTTYQILNRIPPQAREDAIATIGGRIRSALRTGGIEGAQEALSQVAQNVVSREYYAPEQDILEGSGESFGLGGAAGAAVDLALTSLRAPAVRRDIARREEEVLAKIDEDLLEDQPEILDQISRGIIAEEGVPEQPATTDAAEAFRAFVPPKPLGLPAPQAGSLAAIAGAGQPTTTPAQTPATGQAIGADVPSAEVSPFRWSQYEAAKQSIIESGDATVPNIVRAASSAGQPVTPAVAKNIRSQLERDGVITADPKAKGKYRSTPESVKPVAMDESLRRSISDVTRDLEEARAARAKAEQDARRAAQAGKKAEATVASRALSAADSMVKTSEATLNDLTARLAQAPAAFTVPTTERPASRRVGMQAVIPAAQEPAAAAGAVAAQADIQTKEGRDAAVAARAGRLTQAAENYTAQAQQKIAAASSIEAQGRKVQLPKSEADRIASLRAEAARDMDAAKNLRSAAERASSDVQKMRERQAAEAARQVAATAAKSNRTPEYDARQAQLTNAMRKRLDGLGLKDVDVRGAPILEIEYARKGVLVEGMFDVEDGKRVISLSMGIYEPGASEADTLKKIAAVMDHEVIHALRNLGVIKEAEWKSLSSLAARQKYMREKDGKTVERQYTYLQRAERMNADADPEVQVEEAVAEMYRDFAAGRLKIGGRPRSIMERIRDFFRAIIRSHKDVGITDPAAMFEAIKSGQVGARDRTEVDVEGDAARMSRASADGKKDMRRFSRVSIPDSLRKMTIIDRYDERGNFRQDRPIRPDGRVGSRTKEDAVYLLQQQRGGKTFEPSDASEKQLAMMMAAEAEAALSADDSAIGWYDSKLRAAKSAISLLHPEITTDPGANAALDYAIAVTSNGVSVLENYRAANEQFENWKETGKFQERGYGDQGKSMVSAFKFYNALKDRGMSDAKIADYLSKDTTVSQLRKDAIIRELSMSVGSDEFASTPIKVSYIMGPKIGQGFYQNLRGNFDSLTMDRWWMRMFNRLTGKPFVAITEKALKDGASRVVVAASNPVSSEERSAIDLAMDTQGIDLLMEGNVVDFAREVDRIFQKRFRSAPVSDRPKKTELFLAAGRLALNSEPQLQESPRGPGDRQFMRDVTNRARNILKKNADIDISPADLQALLWYAEKRLWDSLGVKKGLGDDNDYVDGAIALLRSKGFSNERIAKALPAAERGRLDLGPSSGGQDGGVRGRALEGGASQPDATRFSRRSAGARPDQTGGGRDGGTRDRGELRQQGRFLAPLEGSPRVRGASGPDQRLVDVAEKYARDNGIDLRRQAEYVRVDPERAARIAEAYDKMENNPSDPKVRAAYEDMIRQTIAQYRALSDAGYRFWFVDQDNDNGYLDSPWNAMRDIRANQSMGVFPTEAGYGSAETEVSQDENPLLADTGIEWPYGSPSGPMKRVLANDLFRAVHDAFGHGIEGSGFRADGEENAWQAHIRLFTGPAQGAMTSETRGQNSWLNYGPYGESNRSAQVEDTVFAPQKIGVMPEWTWTEGRAADDAPYPSPESRRFSRRSTAGAMSPKTQKKVQSNQSALMYARSADTIAKGLQLGGYGLDERRARKFVDGALRRFQDSMLPVGRMIQELSAKGMDIVDAMDTYLQQEIMDRKIGAMIEKNTKDLYEPLIAAVKRLNVPAQRIDQLKRASTSAAGHKGFVELAIEQYGSNKLTLAEAYVYARHAKERNRYILENRDDQNTKGSGMSEAEADAILRWFESLDPANKKAITDIAKYARLIVANTNQTRVGGGIVSRDVVNIEEGDTNKGTSYGYYVPLRGILNEDAASIDDAMSMPPATPRYGSRGKEDPKALGRKEYASDILANLMTQNQNAIVRAERNKVGQSFLRLLRADPTMTESYARILPTPPKIRDTVNGKIVMRTDPNAYKRPDILVVKEDGKETFVQFDDLSLAGAMNGQNGFGPETGGALLRGMSMVNRYLASINTSYNPAFIITNVFRDSMTGLVNLNQFEIKGLSSEVAKNILPSIKGIAGAVLRGDTTSPWAKVYADFVESGGQNATNSFDTLEERVNDLRGLLSEISDAGSKSQWSRMKNSFVGQKGASLLNTVESINTAAENGIRVATYKALLDRGFTKERAAQAAGNVTVNFSKGGDYRRLLNGVFLFYNASIQGTFAMLNAATRSRKVQALWVGIMAAGLVNDMFNAMMFGEDDDGELIYDKIPQHILQNNIILPDLLGTGDRSYISIPMPYGLNMAYNTGRSVSRFMRGNYSAAEATSSIFGTAVDVLNPIGSGDTFLDPNTVSPTILDPIVDLLSNEDFSGKPIYKEALGFDRTPDPASQRYWSTTSPSAVWIAKNLNSLFGGNEVRPGPLDVSPDVIQFWFEFLTGGVGRFVQQSGESIASVGTGDFGEGFIENFPVLNRVVRTVSEREDMSSYIEGAERVLTAEAELKRAREVGDQQWAQRTIQRYGAELRVVGQIRSAETALRRLSRQRGEIESNPRIPEAQKAVMLDRIEERRQQVLARANAVLSSLD